MAPRFSVKLVWFLSGWFNEGFSVERGANPELIREYTEEGGICVKAGFVYTKVEVRHR